MVGLCLVSWALLTACGEYVAHEASFANGWRERRAAAKGWWSKMLACFACPWGWSSLVSGLVVGFCLVLWYINPWAVVPVVVVLLPAFGLGLARFVTLLSPAASRS